MGGYQHYKLLVGGSNIISHQEQYTEVEQEQLNVALHFRISLVGAQFSVISASIGGLVSREFTKLLIRLIRHPIIDTTQLGEGVLFYTLLDMLAALSGPLDR